jgi:hypothetical protein
MVGLVLDCSALIPCGEKPEEIKEAIIQLGVALPNSNSVVYLSRKMIRLYQTVVKPWIENRCPLEQSPTSQELLRIFQLTTFQERLFRILSKLGSASKCKVLSPRESSIKLHVLEEGRLEPYRVDDLGLEKEDDREVLRVALAAAQRHEKIFLVTSDGEFFEDLKYEELLKRYEEGKRVKVVLPNDSELMSSLSDEANANAYGFLISTRIDLLKKILEEEKHKRSLL